MELTFSPLEVIALPNYFSFLDRWEVSKNVGQRLYAMLEIDDNLGKRRYSPAAGSTIKIKFMRSRDYIVGGFGSVDQTFEVTGSIDSTDRSIVFFDLDSDQINKVYPGTVHLILKEDGIDKILKKNYTIAVINTGVGC